MRPLHAVTAAVALALLLGACGSDEPSASPPQAEPVTEPSRDRPSSEGKGKGKHKRVEDDDASPVFPAEADHPLRELAAYWAPLIENDTSRPDYRPDFITRADYDGDWDLTNNYDQRNDFVQPAWAYWWGTQTTTHVFLGYAFYRVATEADAVSENEMTGIVLAIRFPTGADERDPRDPGRFEAMLVWSQGRYQAYKAKSAPPTDPELRTLWSRHLKPVGPINARANATVGNVNFLLDDYGLHPVLYSNDDVHELSAGPPDRTDGVGKFKVSVTDWRRKDYGAKQITAGDSWGEYRGDPQDGIVYAYSGDAQLAVVGKSGKGRGRYKHHWEIVGYDLVSLSVLWNRRGDSAVMHGDGVLAGAGPRTMLQRAPWAWKEDRPNFKDLDPVLRPGELVSALVRLPPPFDPEPDTRQPPLD